ncbi:MAG: hypothetical protein ABR998_15065 [Gemmatimonadales bacterium]
MRSRHTLMVAILMALAAAPAIAQSPQGPPADGGYAQHRMQMLLNGIALTPVQQARIDSIQAAYRARTPARIPGVTPDSATRAQRRELGRMMDADMRAVLTPAQQAVWDKNYADLQLPGA